VSKRHEVVWTDGDSFDDSVKADTAEHGRSTGRGFLGTLVAGDRVGVVPKAKVSTAHLT
jgi:hypothetical protein